MSCFNRLPWIEITAERGVWPFPSGQWLVGGISPTPLFFLTPGCWTDRKRVSLSGANQGPVNSASTGAVATSLGRPASGPEVGI